MGEFNAHVGVDVEKWNGVIGKNGPSDLNNNGMKLTRFCANNGLSIMNTFFEHRKVPQYTCSCGFFGTGTMDARRQLSGIGNWRKQQLNASLKTSHNLIKHNLKTSGLTSSRHHDSFER
ncbi:unnamed protein product [Soboliphyme baturini]|uniref:Craniofacial development protein 2-like n=1 Tax=Soboliphyme baturini TaxID=241478 RepID=A0A183IZD2_9BILA|nr:unnamed protein product [Soboliphyme baturini]